MAELAQRQLRGHRVQRAVGHQAKLALAATLAALSLAIAPAEAKSCKILKRDFVVLGESVALAYAARASTCADRGLGRRSTTRGDDLP
jgi:hypothetical protein